MIHGLQYPARVDRFSLQDLSYHMHVNKQKMHHHAVTLFIKAYAQNETLLNSEISLQCIDCKCKRMSTKVYFKMVD